MHLVGRQIASPRSVDRYELWKRVEANLQAAVENQLRAQQLVHDARNIRQRIAGRRFVASLPCQDVFESAETWRNLSLR